jgi:hypothetical protein
MERFTERFADRYEDRTVAIWVCPDAHEVEEMSTAGPIPSNVFCGKCGKPKVMGCPRKECPDPVFHPSDYPRDYHRVCQEPIPWAKARNGTIWVGPPWRSKLVGDIKPSDRDTRIALEKAAAQTIQAKGEKTPATEPRYYEPAAATPREHVREMTPGERQDLIVAPSGRRSSVPTVEHIIPLAHGGTDSVDNLVVVSGALNTLKRAQEGVERPLRKVVRGVATFLGHSVSKGVENAIAKVVEYGLLGSLLFVLLRFGLNVGWLR